MSCREVRFRACHSWVCWTGISTQRHGDTASQTVSPCLCVKSLALHSNVTDLETRKLPQNPSRRSATPRAAHSAGGDADAHAKQESRPAAPSPLAFVTRATADSPRTADSRFGFIFGERRSRGRDDRLPTDDAWASLRVQRQNGGERNGNKQGCGDYLSQHTCTS